jgi:hypothetical protein
MEIFVPKNGILISINNPEKTVIQKIIESTKDWIMAWHDFSLF